MTSLLPKVRFTSFSDEWTSSIIKNETSYVDYRGKTPKKVHSGVLLITAKNIKEGFIDYQASAEFVEPSDYDNVMSRGKPKIGDVLFTTEAPLGNVAQVDREDIALAQRVIKFDGKNSVTNDFLKQYFLSAPFRKKLDQKSIGSTVKGIKGSELHKMEIVFPSTNEQQKIADFLSSVDKKISLLKEKHALLTQYKKGVMQKLFKKEIRFKDDNGNDFPDWEVKKGNKVFDAISNKNHDSDLPILAITQEHGAIPRDLINYQVQVTEGSVAGYKVVEQGDFIISLRSFQGGIEYSNYKGICSPAYIILRPSIKVNDDFYRYYLKTGNFIQEMKKRLEGIRDGKILSYKYFSEINLPSPCVEEQQKIAEFLLVMDKKLETVSQQIELTQTFKKGLLQQMFV